MSRTHPRCAFITIGQAPRDDILREVLAPAYAQRIILEQFGVMDGMDGTEIDAIRPIGDERCFFTRLSNGNFVSVQARPIEERLRGMVAAIDEQGYDLIVLLSTGIFESWPLRTRLIHSQKLLDLWIDALVMGDRSLGIVLPQQFIASSGEEGGTTAMQTALVQTARIVEPAGESSSLDDMPMFLKDVGLIVMHSLSYSEREAEVLASRMSRPVVPVRRLVSSALRSALDEWFSVDKVEEEVPEVRENGDILESLPAPSSALTPRERDVLRAALRGLSNKEIGRELQISYRTVEIHRARALAKMQASSATELLRRALVRHGS